MYGCMYVCTMYVCMYVYITHTYTYAYDIDSSLDLASVINQPMHEDDLCTDMVLVHWLRCCGCVSSQSRDHDNTRSSRSSSTSTSTNNNNSKLDNVFKLQTKSPTATLQGPLYSNTSRKLRTLKALKRTLLDSNRSVQPEAVDWSAHIISIPIIKL